MFVAFTGANVFAAVKNLLVIFVSWSVCRVMACDVFLPGGSVVFCSAGRMLFFSRKYQKHDGCRVVYGKRKRLAHGMCKNMGGNAVFFNDYYYLCNR